MDDTGAHLAEGDGGLVLALLGGGLHLCRWLNDQVGVGDMRGIVDGESETNDQEDSDDTVHGEVPVVHESEKEDIDEQNRHSDQCGHRKTASDE